MSRTLTTTQVYPPTSAPMPITIPRVLSYEFQVVEYVDADGKITKVELQSRENEHDNNGVQLNYPDWKPVPRIRIQE